MKLTREIKVGLRLAAGACPSCRKKMKLRDVLDHEPTLIYKPSECSVTFLCENANCSQQFDVTLIDLQRNAVKLAFLRFCLKGCGFDDATAAYCCSVAADACEDALREANPLS